MERGVVAMFERGIPAALLGESDLRRRALLAVGIAWFVLAVGVVIGALLFVTMTSELRWVGLINTLVTCGLAALAVLMVRRGRLVLAGNWIAGLIAVGVAYSVVVGGGVGAPFTVTVPVPPVIALLISGRRSGIVWGLVSAATVLSILAIEKSGVPLPDLNPPEGESILATIATVAVIGVTIWVASFSESLKERAIREVEEAGSRLDEARAEEEKAKSAAAEAIAANTAKGAFLATMSHELRTPLNVMMGYSELIEEELGEAVLGEHVESLRRIRTSGEHLLGLISDILDLAKIEADRLELHPELFDISPLLHDLAATFEPLARKRGDRILVIVDGGNLLFLDKTRIRQVLVNLLGNAIKFTSDGVITLGARRVEEGGRAWIEVTVADTGIGISSEKIGAIFDSFVQADSSSTRAHQGSGLGLAIVRKLCDMMGASVDATSTPGEGTSLRLRLPAVGPALHGSVPGHG